MPWIAASLLSAFLLGCYELCTKHAVRDNAVLPVLFLSNACAAACWVTLLLVQAADPHLLPAGLLVDPLTFGQHAQLLLKSVIVASSWLCTYFAVKHLPVSIASPIRAASPIGTMLGGLLLLAERPSGLQMLGVGITLFSFVGLSRAGHAEGVHFFRNPWVGWAIAGTVLNSISGLYDKFLLGHAGFRAPTVQCWFVIYAAALFLPFAVGWKLRWWTRHEFTWRWSIPLLALALLAADYVYFSALQNPAALISLVASLRRGSTLVAFAGGLWFFHEKPGAGKIMAVLGVLAGIALTVLG